MTAPVVEPRVKYKLLPSSGSKSVSLRVNRDATVTVRAPGFVSHAEIERFVARRVGWIEEKQEYFKELLALYPPKEFKNGESFQFLGRNLRLKLFRAAGRKHVKCAAADSRLKIYLDGQTGKEFELAAGGAIKDFYSKHTGLRAMAFVRKHAGSLAIKPGRVLVVDQQKRWGSCSRNGDIRINWRLAMMPPAIIEYIVVHELCHLKVHDHSPKFWSILKSVLPDYENRRAWLRRNGAAVLLIADWGQHDG
ncbi:MAG TPA: SprT family zinc-dependent metalloprotease [Elusimicrobiales bacterium]|nr:SprT family zinc-dependent metalloprotease [Elusimicrobiales bacterium]